MRAATRCLVLTALTVLSACSGNNNGGNTDGSADGADIVSSMDSARDGANTDGGQNRADGPVVLPDGAILLPDGNVVAPDGGTTRMDGGDGGTRPGDGSTNPDGSSNPDGDAGPQPPDGSTVLPDGAVILPDGGIWDPNHPNGCPAFPDGRAACGADEVCGNGVDDDCDGLVDEQCSCQPGQSERCYDGCPSEAGMGVCTYGTMACVGSGEFGTYDGHCQGAGHPQVVQCGGLRDYKCDGIIDEGCSCMAGEMRPCYDGPASTRNVGACQDGVQSCVSADGGTGWGPCQGEVLPTAAQCDGIDHACTGDPYADCVCIPGTTRTCYDGPTGTENVGICHGGMQGCVIANGVASWGPCVGEVTPTANRCDGIDRACTGMPDTGCACAVGNQRSCYDGPTGTDGVGLCHGGVQQCTDTGSGPMWGACIGEVIPSASQCDGLDHLCNGMPNQGCQCTPGSSRSCYDGPVGTEGVGVCRAGTQSCVTGSGGVGTVWGPCSGEVLPGAIQCDGLDHACDGNYSADCPCMPGQTRNCYDGPAGTAGVGTCQPGTQTCQTRTGGGSQWGTCSGEVLPAAPQCDGLDHACTGMFPNCNPTVMCPAPVTTSVNVGVVLRGTASAIAPATVSSYNWSVISQPAGSTFTFSSTSTNPTTFTATNAGVYTVRLTVVDSMGRSSSCSVLVTVTSRSYLGTEFWAVSTSNTGINPRDRFDFAVGIGNPNAATVTVTVTGGVLTSALTFTVPANSTVTQALPWVDALAQRGANGSVSRLATSGAYKVTTSAPVSAYQFNPLQFQDRANFSYTNDASLLLPTVALTGNYLAMSHQAWYSEGGFVAIVGTSATQTTVTVRLTSAISAGTGVAAAAAGSTQTYRLNQGDVVQLVTTHSYNANCVNDPRCGGLPCANFCPYDPEDITGTTITADQPVAVFGGHDCSNISSSGDCPACDHLEQQLFPMETWGRDVVVSQFRDRGNTTEPYIVRIMSREDGNTLSFVPSGVHASVTLNRGQFVEFCETRDFEVTSTQPVLVGKFMVGQNVTSCTTCATTATSSNGDPSFTLEVPTTQYRHDYNFVVPASYTSSFINVVGATGATILLDGTALTATPVAIAGTSWSIWRQSVTAGSHQINTAGTSGFGLEVLGVASYTSYAYPGGLDLATLP